MAGKNKQHIANSIGTGIICIGFTDFIHQGKYQIEPCQHKQDYQHGQQYLVFYITVYFYHLVKNPGTAKPLSLSENNSQPSKPNRACTHHNPRNSGISPAANRSLLTSRRPKYSI